MPSPRSSGARILHAPGAALNSSRLDLTIFHRVGADFTATSPAFNVAVASPGSRVGTTKKQKIGGDDMAGKRWMARRHGVAAAGMLCVWALCGRALAATEADTITVGSLALQFCDRVFIGYCGSITRPLDPTGNVAGSIKIALVWYPRRDQSQPSLGTLLPQEGGPGFSTRGTAGAYLNIYGALRNRRDVLIVDKRGTGLSAAVDCAPLQKNPSSPADLQACGQQLGVTAPLYNTRLAADDVVAVMDALQVSDVDYYGDSYGTYFGQVLAAFHPDRLRTIILDSAYPVRAPDVWFPTDWITGRDGLDKVCQRTPACNSLPGSATGRLQRLLDRLRKQPIRGIAPDANGRLTQVTLDVSMLFLLVTDLGAAPITYRDLDSATRAWLDTGDALPLLRLVAEYDTPAFSAPEAFSYGEYQAIICGEYPLLYDLGSPTPQRRTQYHQSIARASVLRPDLFAPFTLDEAIRANADITPLGTCLDWPVPPPDYPQGPPIPANAAFPAVPTLVLSGDLDSVTSPEDADQVAALFPDAVHLIIPNLTHVTAYYYSDVGYLPDGGDTTHCVEPIIRRFISERSAGDTSCIQSVRPLRSPPKFAAAVAQLTPPEALAGNQADVEDLQAAAAALETVGDVFARFILTVGHGAGLRGGSFTYVQESDGYTFTLDSVRWTDDLEVSGSLRWLTASGDVVAGATLRRNGQVIGRLQFAWNDIQVDATVSLYGTLHGKRVHAQRIAP